MSETRRDTWELGAPSYPVLNAFMGCRERVSVIIGPLGSGKTYGVVQRLLLQMAEQAPNAEGIRPTRWLAVRNSYPELHNTTIKDFLAVFGDRRQAEHWALGEMRYGGMEPPQYQARFRLPDGSTVKSEVIFLALDRQDAVRKLQGTQLTGIWLNETQRLVRAVVDMADDRHGRYPSLADGGVRPTWHGMIGDTNAPDEEHWLYELAEEIRPRGWAFFRQPGGVTDSGETDATGRRIWRPNSDAENLANLPGGSEYYMSKIPSKSDDYIRVMYANEYGFTVDGKPVHPEYVDSVHCAGVELEPEPRYPLVLGIDFGRTPACAITQHWDHQGRWVVLDEFCSENMSAALFGPELKRYLERHYPRYAIRAYGDPAGDSAGQSTEDTPIRILQAAGIPVEPCESNAPALRRAAVANPCTRLCLDGRPAFRLSPKAKIIRKGLMGGYCYRRLHLIGEERYSDLPDKNSYSHPVEALEYALLGGGEGRAALQRPETRQGPRQAYALM